MLALTVIAAMLATVAIVAIWSGYVLTILWAWFVVPAFGLPALALSPAIGLTIVVGYLTHQYMPEVAKKGSQWDQFAHAAGHMVMRPAMALLVGWVVKQWI